MPFEIKALFIFIVVACLGFIIYFGLKDSKKSIDIALNKQEESRQLDKRCFPYVRAGEFWTDKNQYAVCITADGGLEIK
jgi:hypothetical protein